MKKIVLGMVFAASLVQSSVTIDGFPRIVKQNGDEVYVVTDNKIEVIDILSKSDPININSITLESKPLDVTINGNNFYLITEDGLYIYKIKENSSLSLEGILKTQFARKVFILNDKAYIANYMDGVQIVDISDKTNPKLEKFYEYKTANDIYVKNNIVYLSTKNYGLIILDISKTTPVELSRFMVKDFTSMEAKGNNLYFSNKYKGMYIVDISNPSEPTFKKQLVTKSSDIKVSSNNAYLINQDLDILEFIDISVPEVPKLVNYKELNGLSSIDSDDEYIYAVDSKGLKIYDNSGKTLYDENSVTISTQDKLVKTLNKGWNLIGNPITNSFETKNIKDSLIIWSYKDEKWTMNPEQISSSTGFWVYNKNIEVVEFVGKKSNIDFKNLVTGWTILSNGTDIDEVTSNNENIQISWIYEQGEWAHNPAMIKAGRGFWVLSK